MFSTGLSTRSHDGQAAIALRGELDLADAAAVVAGTLTMVPGPRAGHHRGPGRGLEFIDSSGVATLAHGRRQARQAGGNLVLAAPQRKVAWLLAAVRLAKAWSVYATVKEGRPAGRTPGCGGACAEATRQAALATCCTWPRARDPRTLSAKLS